MRVKLLRELLIGSSDTMPARRGTVLETEGDRGRQWIDLGLAEATNADVTTFAEAAAAVVRSSPANPPIVKAPEHEVKGTIGTVQKKDAK